MALEEINDMADCLELTDTQQNAAIYYLLKARETDHKIQEATVAELKKISAAVESLKKSDVEQGLRWSFLDKIGATVLMMISSVIGGTVVWLLQHLRG